MPESLHFSCLAAATIPGSAVNEDAFGLWPSASAAQAAWVLDGVTGINDRALLPGPTDAAWFVAEVQEILPKLLDQQPELPAGDLVAALVTGLAERQAASWIDPAGADGRETPAASFSLVRIIGQEIEVASLGDCLVLMELVDRVVQATDHPVLDEIEQDLKREMRAIRATGVHHLPEIRARMMPALRAARRKRNVPGGYGVLSADQACLPMLEIRRYPTTVRQRLLLVSDGYYRLVDHYQAMTDSQLMNSTAAPGVDVLMRQLRAIEAEDQDAARFPRFKTSDDATALLLEVE